MTSSLYKFLLAFDAYGNPISVNFRGATSYKTGLGAVFTVLIKGFLLFYLATSLLDLREYKDPQITQYTIYDPRITDDQVNLADSRGTFIFSVFDQNGNVVKPDPRMFSLEYRLNRKSFDGNGQTTVEVLQ